MRLYGLYTPTHETLLREWFLASLRDDFDLRLRQHEQVGTPDRHCYGTVEFNQTTLSKVEVALQAIEDNWGEIFVLSDVDIQFFGPTEEHLRESMRDRDIMFQQNQANGEINTGFFVCRGNARARNLWLSVRKVMRERPDWNDQDALNYLMFRDLPCFIRGALLSHTGQHRLARLAELGIPTHWVGRGLRLFGNSFDLRWGFLPIIFFLKGINSRGSWEPEKRLRVPKRIVMHHANFCVGVDAKVKQLCAVKAIVAGRETGHHAIGG